jgi:hypothetical protein
MSFSIKSCGAVQPKPKELTEEEKGELDYLYDSNTPKPPTKSTKPANPKDGMSIQIVRSGSTGSIHPDMH